MAMSKRPQKIQSQQELDDLIGKCKKDRPLECFILLRHGLRSSKFISLNENGDYYVYHECDDTEEVVNHGTLMDTFIGKSIKDGAFYRY